MNGYDLSRKWFDFCFENPEKITPNHTALYFFCIEHCNRLGWKCKFGLPTTMAKEAIGIRSYNTYIKTLTDLISFGFIIMVEKSKNQYSSNIIALSNFNKALDKALDKALIKHTTKQSESTCESIDSIYKQETINNEQETINDFGFNNENIKNEFCNNLLDLFNIPEDYRKLNLQKLHNFYSKLTKENNIQLFLDTTEKFKKYWSKNSNLTYTLDNYISGKWSSQDWSIEEVKSTVRKVIR